MNICDIHMTYEVHLEGSDGFSVNAVIWLGVLIQNLIHVFSLQSLKSSPAFFHVVKLFALVLLPQHLAIATAKIRHFGSKVLSLGIDMKGHLLKRSGTFT